MLYKIVRDLQLLSKNINYIISLHDNVRVVASTGTSILLSVLSVLSALVGDL